MEKLRNEESLLDVDVAAADLDHAGEDVSRGLYCDPMGSVQVNIQTCEVYLRDRMLMPGRGRTCLCAPSSSTVIHKHVPIPVCLVVVSDYHYFGVTYNLIIFAITT